MKGYVVHWVTGDVPCCEKHAKQLIAVGKHLGTHVVASESDDIKECKNCKNTINKNN